KPELFFNMDADSELGERALERMALRLVSPSALTGKPGSIVTSHVAVPSEFYWRGYRRLSSVRGMLALLVAREYLVSIGLGRYNLRLIPRTGVSGALYCTWFEVMRVAPYYARFLRELRPKEWLAWWAGARPPSFSA